MNTTRPFSIVVAVAAFVMGGACSPQDSEPVEEEIDASDATAAAEQPAALLRTASPDGATVFFITPADGDSVPNPITVEFGLEGMSVIAAGIDQAQSGHHHLLIDADLPDLGLPVPADSRHIHFGDASTSTQLTLAPGEHTLRLLLGDYLHIPHDPPVISDVITITVE